MNKRKPASIRPAVEGESFWFDQTPGMTRVVQPKAEGNNGLWCCLTCGLLFDNQLMKDIHIGGKKARRDHMIDKKGDMKFAHVLGWVSLITGNVEVP